MKRGIIKLPGFFLFVLIILLSSSRAQDIHGGLGNFFSGAVYNNSSSLQTDLSSGELLGDNLELNKLVFSYGGAGYSVRPRGFVLGGSGYTYQVSSDAVNGNANLSVSCGFFNIGYRVINKNKCLGFPYTGMGGFGTNFKITNSTSEKMMVIGTDTIGPGKQSKYSTGGLAFDVGFALKYFAFNMEKKEKNKAMGAVLGIDAGASFFPAFGKWEHVVTGDQISTMSNPFIMTAYLRITVGFGVFSAP